MSENLAVLAAYSDAMLAGDREAVFDCGSPDFVSHVTARVNPDAVGADVRGHELEWWTEVRSAFPDMTFTVGLLIGSDDRIVSNGTAILRMRDGKVVEHWGGSHCQDGVGLTHPPAAA
jgi:predicted ester cyclase